MTNISFFQGGKSYEELKKELGDEASPVNVPAVRKVSHFSSFLGNRNGYLSDTMVTKMLPFFFMHMLHLG